MCGADLHHTPLVGEAASNNLATLPCGLPTKGVVCCRNTQCMEHIVVRVDNLQTPCARALYVDSTRQRTKGCCRRHSDRSKQSEQKLTP